jgi:capsular exopolysaccharide synthesis family protein
MALSENAELEELIRQATATGTPDAPPPGQATTEEDDATGDGIDFTILAHVARRSLPWVFLLLALGLTGSWLYLRYTKPVYKASSVLKIEEEQKASVLGFPGASSNDGPSTKLAGEVELIKSELTYNRLKKLVPLDVNYYTKGTVLENELFGTSPFRVEYSVSDAGFYNIPFEVEYIDNQHYNLSVKIGAETMHGSYKLGQLARLPGLNLRLLAADSSQQVGGAVYHFALLDNSAIDKYLNLNLTVEVLNPNANTIQIAFTDNNRSKAITIVNAIDSVYLQAKLAEKSLTTTKIRAFVTDQLKEYGRKLAVAEDNLTGFARRNKTYDAKAELATTSSKQEVLIEQRLKLEEGLQLLEDIKQLAAEARLTTREDQSVSQSIPGLADISDPLLVQALEQLNNQQLNLARVKRSYKSGTFTVEDLNAQLATAQQAVQHQIVQDQRLLRKKINRLDEQNAELVAKLGALPGVQTEQARLERPLDLYNNIFQNLLQKQIDYEITNAGTNPDFQVLSSASAPADPISPKRLLVYAIGFASGLVLGIGLIAGRYLLHNTVTSVGELERNTKAAVLGVIPTYTKEAMEVSRLVVDKNPKASVSEAIRSIRTNLDFISPSTKKRLISITSTISGEGKTFVAVNLAGIIALSGQRVIILDLDMRKPKVNLAFGAENVRGISTILIDRHTLAECVQHTTIESLDFISAGPTPPNPSELILSPRFDQLIQELHQHYDVIMIDTPPVGLVTDGILIMRKADVPIYIVRANYSRKTFLKNLNRLMRNNQFGRMCTILNDAQAQGASGYGYGYGYGYGQGYGSYGMGYYEDPTPGKPTIKQRIKQLFS